MKIFKYVGTIAALCVATAVLATGCGSKKTDNAAAETENKTTVATTQEAVAKPQTARPMLEQGNSRTVALADIVEESGDEFRTWIKLSTLYDPLDSMYQADVIPEGTVAIVVDFTIENLESETEIFWNYQVQSGETGFSVWDTSSPADKLTVKEDGSYRLVFDAQTALGGTVDVIESLQFVIPSKTDTLTTTVTVNSAITLTDTADLEFYQTGALE